MGRRQAAGAAQLRSIRRRWSAHRCRPLAAHRPLFLAVPEIDDEDRLGAGLIHPMILVAAPPPGTATPLGKALPVAERKVTARCVV